MNRSIRSLRNHALLTLPALLAAGLTLSAPARADFKIQEPVVVKNEIEIESYADRSYDRHADKNNAQSQNIAIGMGITDWWKAEVEGEFEREPGGRNRFSATTFENIFQPFEQGQFWVDPGFFAEYSHAAKRGDADSVTFGPLLQKQIGRTIHTLNLLLTREFATSTAQTGMSLNYGWQSRWVVTDAIQPGFEIFGEPGKIGHFKSADEQQHRAGPILAGSVPVPWGGKIKYEAGALFALTGATERVVPKLQLEYEIVF